MGEERSIIILLPLEMLERIFCQLSFETLKVCVSFAFPYAIHALVRSRHETVS